MKHLLKRVRDYIESETRECPCMDTRGAEIATALLAEIDKAIAGYAEIEVEVVDEMVSDSAGYNKRLMFRGQRSFHSLRLTTNEAENIARFLDGKVLRYKERRNED